MTTLLNETLLDTIDSIDGRTFNIKSSNEKSQTIKFIQKILTDNTLERFCDKLLVDESILKIMTTAIIDIQFEDISSPIFLFSSKLDSDPPEGKKPRKEYSENCKYKINPELRTIADTFGPYMSKIATGDFSEFVSNDITINSKLTEDILFNINYFYGNSLDAQVSQGFLNRKQLLGKIETAYEMYEKSLNELLKIGICSAFQHACWCNHIRPETAPYAIWLFGNNEIGKKECPICERELLSCRFIKLYPSLVTIMKYHGGILPSLVGWYLHKNKYQWTADVTINGKEYGDIIFKDLRDNRLYLLECKVHGRDKKMRGYDRTIEKDVKQIISHVEFWENQNVKIEKAHVLTNFIGNEQWNSIRDSVIDKLKDEISSRRIKVHPIGPIGETISEIIG